MRIAIILTVTHAGSGLFYRISGKAKPDHYLFTQVPGQQHLHRLILPIEEWRRVKNDLLDQPLQMPIDLDVEVTVEPGDVEESIRSAASEEVESLKKELQAAQEAAQAAAGQKADMESQLATAGAGGLTEETHAFLVERDAMLDVLGPYAVGDETPLACLQRVITTLEPPSAGAAQSEEPTESATAAPKTPRRRRQTA